MSWSYIPHFVAHEKSYKDFMLHWKSTRQFQINWREDYDIEWITYTWFLPKNRVWHLIWNQTLPFISLTWPHNHKSSNLWHHNIVGGKQITWLWSCPNLFSICAKKFRSLTTCLWLIVPHRDSCELCQLYPCWMLVLELPCQCVILSLLVFLPQCVLTDAGVHECEMHQWVSPACVHL